MSKLTHFDDQGASRMVDVGAKQVTLRSARASGQVRMLPATLALIRNRELIVARELSRDIKLIIASQPTRGLDVGSIEFIHKQLVRIRDEGAAVLLVSSELDEVLGLADRVAVMFEGKITSLVDRNNTDRRTTGLFMAGIFDHPESEQEEVSSDD
jgi:simple sugar transport system ATP-binding protein